MAAGVTVLARESASLGAHVGADAASANPSFRRFVALTVGGFFSLVIAGFWLVQWLMSRCL